MEVVQRMLDERFPAENEPVRLWWISPEWKEFPKSCIALDEEFYYRSDAEAYALLWMRPSWFGSRHFKYPEPVRWIPRCSVVSGASDRIYVGVLFSKHFDEDDDHVWRGLRNIWSTNGGSRSSETCKVILNQIFSGPGLVSEPYARAHFLAVWARRLNVGYRGYAQNQGVRAKIEKELAQVEIPGIQEELPLLIKNGE